MGINAVALLRIPLAQVRAELSAREGSHSKGALRAAALDDATLLHTATPLGSEPAELADRLRELLGEALERHRDERGIYVFPNVAKPTARSYDGVIEELGELGFWVELSSTEPAEAPDESERAASALASAQELLGAVPDGVAGEIQQALARGDYQALEAISQKVETAMGGRERVMEAMQRGAIEDATQEAFKHVQQMLGSATDPAAPGQIDFAKLPFGLPSQDDAPELWAHARKQAETLMQNPEQLAALGRQLGMPVDAMVADFAAEQTGDDATEAEGDDAGDEVEEADPRTSDPDTGA